MNILFLSREQYNELVTLQTEWMFFHFPKLKQKWSLAGVLLKAKNERQSKLLEELKEHMNLVSA